MAYAEARPAQEGEDTVDRRGRPVLPPIGGDPVKTALWIQQIRQQQFQARRPYLRQVEENIRLLSGENRTSFLESAGETIDLSDFYRPGDPGWKRKLVVNDLAEYFELAIAKLTEHLPLMTAQPENADGQGAKLASLWDALYQYEWNQTDMPELLFPAIGWLLVAGGYELETGWDPDRGPIEEWWGQGQVPGFEDRTFERVPYTTLPDGRVGISVARDPAGQIITGPDGLPQFGAPQRQRAGDLFCRIQNPINVVRPLGSELAHRKPWVLVTKWQHVDLLKEQWGVDVEPDDASAEEDLLSTIDFVDPHGGQQGGGQFLSSLRADTRVLRDHALTFDYWCLDSRSQPYGRLLITTRDKVLDDGINPFVIPGKREKVIVPIFNFQRVGFPFRQHGITDLEQLNPLHQAKNARLAAMEAAVGHAEQPTTFINTQAVQDNIDDELHQEGSIIYADTFQVGDPAWRLEAAGLPEGSVQLYDILCAKFDRLAKINIGSEGGAVTDTASGELQRETRYDADRPWSATLRLHSYGQARVAEAWCGILAACIPTDRVLSILGEDEQWGFLEVQANFFDGSIRVRPVPESAQIESRIDKEQRITNIFRTAAEIGASNPALADQFIKAMNYPDLNRMLRPGGEAYSLALKENVEMVMSGHAARVWPEQNHAIHRPVHLEFLQTAQFRDAAPEVQQAFRFHLALHDAAAAVTAAKTAGVAAQTIAAAHNQVDQNLPEELMHPPQGSGGDGAGPTPAGRPAPRKLARVK